MTERADTLRELPIRGGYWLARVHLKAPQVPAAIWWREHEPGDPGNAMDRGHWAAAIAGEETEPHEVIALKDRQAIDEPHYKWLVALRAWALEFAPEDPAALPAKRAADLTTLPPIGP